MSQQNKKSALKNKLPDFKPDQDVWKRIETQLNFDDYLSEQITKLPTYRPSADVWENISKGLQKKKVIRFRFNYLQIAASIAVVVVLSTIMFQLLIKNDASVAVENNYTLTENNMEQTAIAEIRAYCSLQMPACEQTNFKELMQLYDELEAEETELKKAIEQLGDSPEMIQAMIKIENLKSKAIQDMILLIQS